MVKPTRGIPNGQSSFNFQIRRRREHGPATSSSILVAETAVLDYTLEKRSFLVVATPQAAVGSSRAGARL
jgi:hypothetical protein